MKVLLNAFQFDLNGVSEGYLAAKWHQSLSEYCDVDVVSSDKNEGSITYQPSRRFNLKRGVLQRINQAVKLDYFYYNYKSSVELRNIVRNYDVLHHVSPVAPRYPVSLSKYANNFVLGPIAGGLRVPMAFRNEVEGSEELFLKMRSIDALRLKHDKSLVNTYERASKILVAGSYLENILPERFHHKFQPFLDVGVDINTFQFVKRFRGDSKLRLIYVGRVVPYKGLIYLLKAISKLDKNVKKDIELVVAGDRGETQYEKDCYRFVAANNLTESVIFKGFVSKNEVNKLYESSHVFCFPSLAEAGGTVVVEALSKGLPIIAANVGGPAESVNNSCGRLVDVSNPESLVEDLADTIQRFYLDSNLIEALSIGARKRAESMYDWNVRAKRMARIYESCI